MDSSVLSTVRSPAGNKPGLTLLNLMLARLIVDRFPFFHPTTY